MTSLIYQDGHFTERENARFSPFDPALQCGFTLFETVRIHPGAKTFRLDAHLARMNASASALGLDPAPDADALRPVVRRLCEENGVEDGRLRITLARREEAPGSSLLVAVSHAGPQTGPGLLEGWRGFRVPFRQDRRRPSSGHKCGHTLDVFLFRRNLNPLEEGILLNEEGRVSEGCYSNIFAVRDGRLTTPALGEGCLPGITRHAVLQFARKTGLQTGEEAIAWIELLRADEAFLTNAMIGIAPLVELEGAPLGKGEPGQVTAELAGRLLQLVSCELL